MTREDNNNNNNNIHTQTYLGTVQLGDIDTEVHMTTAATSTSLVVSILRST